MKNQIILIVIGCFFMSLPVIYLVNRLFKKHRINKNIYNWIYYTNFGKATVLLNAISSESKDKINLKNKQPWSNFKRINNYFIEMDESEIELIKNYLNQTNRKYKIFEDKLIKSIIGSIQIAGVVAGLYSLIKDGDPIIIALTILLSLFIFYLINRYETERNIRELLLMLVERHGKQNVKCPIGDENK